jgi:hypothetical protein
MLWRCDFAIKVNNMRQYIYYFAAGHRLSAGMLGTMHNISQITHITQVRSGQAHSPCLQEFPDHRAQFFLYLT